MATLPADPYAPDPVSTPDGVPHPAKTPDALPGPDNVEPVDPGNAPTRTQA